MPGPQEKSSFYHRNNSIVLEATSTHCITTLHFLLHCLNAPLDTLSPGPVGFMVCDGEVLGELVVGGGTVLGASLDLRVGDSLGLPEGLHNFAADGEVVGELVVGAVLGISL